MITKRRVDRVGGVGSILIGIACAFIAYRDWQREHSVWKVFALMCVVLVLNGIAMIRHSVRPERSVDSLDPGDGIVSGSSRV